MARYDNEWDRDRGRDWDREHDRDRDRDRDRRHDREREGGRRPVTDYGSQAGWGGQGFNQGSFGQYGGQGERLWTPQGGQGFGAEHGYTGRESGGGMGNYNSEGRGSGGWGGGMSSYDSSRGHESDRTRDRTSDRWGSSGGYGQGSEGWRGGNDRGDESRNRWDDRERNREDWGRDWGGQGFSGREGGWGGYGSYDRERSSGGNDWRSRGSQGWAGGQSMGQHRDWERGGQQQDWNRGGQQQDWGRRGGQFSGRGPKGYTRSDERIREDINERLTDHSDIDASEVEVQVQNGEVTLRGTVDERHTKHLAEDLASNVYGVKDVRNEIRVNRGFWGSIKDAFTGESDDDARLRDRSGQPEATTGERASTTSTHMVTPEPEKTRR